MNIKQNCNEYDLDLTVKIYMNKYGINNVRKVLIQI